MFASFDWQKSISIWFDFGGRLALALKEILSIYLKRAEHPLISEERNLSEYYCALTMWKYPSEKADLFTSSDSLTIIHFPLYRVPLFILLWGATIVNWISVSVIIYYKLSLGNDQRIELKKVNCTFYLFPVFCFTYKGLSTLLNFEEDFQFLQEPASVSLVSHCCHLMA